MQFISSIGTYLPALPNIPFNLVMEHVAQPPQMRPAYNAKAPKRLVNLSLNEDLIAQARSVTNNLSDVVESLLADFVSKERVRKDAHAKALKEAVHTWNAFDEKHGSFADKHSTL